VNRVVVLSSFLFGDEATSIEISVMRRAGLASAAFRLAPSIVYARCKETFLPRGEELPDALDADFWCAFQRVEVRERLIDMCADYERSFARLPSEYWKIRAPVRLLWAEHDGHFPPEQAERLVGLVPGARREIVEGARHWMPISRSEEVARRITRLLEAP
jgi:pimeloyl-ACP methyl ester carboxylesterase